MLLSEVDKMLLSVRHDGERDEAPISLYLGESRFRPRYCYIYDTAHYYKNADDKNTHWSCTE